MGADRAVYPISMIEGGAVLDGSIFSLGVSITRHEFPLDSPFIGPQSREDYLIKGKYFGIGRKLGIDLDTKVISILFIAL